MRIFVQVVENASFAAAARALDISPAMRPARLPAWKADSGLACCNAVHVASRRQTLD